MTVVPDADLVSDAGLAVAAAAGDRTAFAGIYDRYADRLYDFCVGMVRDRDTAADCVQDTFCTAATRLASLRDPDKLRPWLYAIARNEALRCLRGRRREQPSEELPEATSGDPGPDTLAVRGELAELVAAAAGGLSERDRTVLELTYRHGLDGPELAEALGVSAATARTLTHRLRETVERSLGALLVVRNARTGQGCGELAASVKDWDGQFTVLTRKRVARHIDACPVCQGIRGTLVNPRALLGGAPLFIPAPPGLRAHTLDRIQLTCAETAITGPASPDPAGPAGTRAPHPGSASSPPTGASSAPSADTVAGSLIASPPDGDVAAAEATDGEEPGDHTRRRRRWMLVLLALLAAAGIAALGLSRAGLLPPHTPVSPAGVTPTANQPTPAGAPSTQAPPAPTAPPSPPPPPPAARATSISAVPTPHQAKANPVAPSGSASGSGSGVPATAAPAAAVPTATAATATITAPTAPATTAPPIAIPRTLSPSAVPGISHSNSPHHPSSPSSPGSSGAPGISNHVT